MNYHRACRALQTAGISQQIIYPLVGYHSYCCKTHVCKTCSTNPHHINIFIKRYKVDASPPRELEKGFLKKLLRQVGWLDHSKAKLKVSGYIHYESVADQVQYQCFFKEFSLPDTFFSWFLVTELHIWMLLVRAMNEGDEGRFLRNCVVEAMWADISTRAKKLGAANPSSVREQVQDLSQQFNAALIGYDEGLLSDDKVLAGAVWRRFFQRDCDQPENIERLVHYIRKQVSILEKIPKDEILLKPNVKWIDIIAVNNL